MKPITHTADTRVRPRREMPAWGYPMITVIAMLVVWQFLVTVLRIPTYLLPSPTVIMATYARHSLLLAQNTWVTASEALAGLALSIMLGVPLAAALVWSRLLDRAITPLLIFSQTFPKVALAPLLVVWMGVGFTPKALISFLVAFFPVVIAGLTGLRSVETELLELAHSYRASAFHLFWKIRLPAALPNLFAGFKLAATFSVIGAVVGEWQGADRGLGYIILWANSVLDTPLVFAAIGCLAFLGSCLYYATALLERWALPWHVSMQPTAADSSGL